MNDAEKMMLAKKLEFSNEVVNVIREMCQVVFNTHSDEEMIRIFGVSSEQMKDVVSRIIDALPDAIFTQKDSQLLEEIKYICAREYIFFQVQEKWVDLHYQENLSRFIQIFSRDIQRRINLQQSHTTMREEK